MPENFVYASPPGENDILQGADSLAEQQIERQRIAAENYRAQLQNQLGQSALGLQAQQQAFNQNQSQAQPQMFQPGSYQSPGSDGGGVFSAPDHVEVGKVLDGQIDQIVQTVSKQRLNPQGQAQYSDWAGKLRAVQKMRSNLRPEQYNQLSAKLINDFRQRRINNYVVKVPTVQEDWMANAIPSHDGGFLVRDYDKNGRPRFKRIEAGPHDATLGPMSPQQRFEASMAKTPDGGFAVYDPDKGWQVHPAKPSKEHERPSLSEYLADRDNYTKEYEAAAKRLERGSADGTFATPEQIQSEMDRYLRTQEAHVFSRRVMDQLPAMGQQQPAPVGGGQAPQGPQVAQPSPTAWRQGGTLPAAAQVAQPSPTAWTPGGTIPSAPQGPQQGAPQQQAGPVPPQQAAPGRKPPQVSPAAIQAMAQHALNGPHDDLPEWKESDGIHGIWGQGQPINPNLKRLAFTRQLHQQLGGDPNSQYALQVLTGAWHVYPHASELYKTLGQSSDAKDYEAARHLVLSRLKGVETPEAKAIRSQMRDFSIGAMQQEIAKLDKAPRPSPAELEPSVTGENADKLSANVPQPAKTNLQQVVDGLPKIDIKNPKRGQFGQVSDDRLAEIFDRGKLLSEHLPGMKDDLKFLRDSIEKHGANPNEWPHEDKKRADKSLTAIAAHEESSKKPWIRPAKEAQMVPGAVYELIRKSDGRPYRAIWNGKEFVTIDTDAVIDRQANKEGQ